MSPPNVSKLSLMFFSSESTAVNTDMTQKIPMVIPVSDRKDLSFDDLSSSKDNLRLWKNILKITFTQRSYAKALISAIQHRNISSSVLPMLSSWALHPISAIDNDTSNSEDNKYPKMRDADCKGFKYFPAAHQSIPELRAKRGFIDSNI